jgi:hypothetical protein
VQGGLLNDAQLNPGIEGSGDERIGREVAMLLSSAERGQCPAQDARHELGAAATGNLLDKGNQCEEDRDGIQCDRLGLL